MALEQLIEMSHRYGGNPDYAPASAGSASMKENGVLYIKGAGTSLAAIRAEQFVAMDMASLSAIRGKKYPEGDNAREAAALADIMAARLPDETKSPDEEVILHAIFPYRFVLRVHPALVNGLTCSRNGETLCRELLGGDAVWVPAIKPGYILSVSCKKAFDLFQSAYGKNAQIMVLQNHGIFAAADTVEEMDRLVSAVMTVLGEQVQHQPDCSPVEFDTETACLILPAFRMLYAGEGNAAGTLFSNTEILRLVTDEGSMTPLMEPFTPDHIAGCGVKPLFVSPGDDYKAAFGGFVTANGRKPKIVAVKGIGIIALGATKQEAEIAKLLFLDAVRIATYSESFGGPSPLEKAFADSVINRQTENCHQKSAMNMGADKRLKDKIAVVTGSAQGFGKGIAQSLARHGAYLVIADLNAEGAAACAAGLNAEYGDGTAISVTANVAREDSVKALVEACVLAYGGLDIFISNAGIAIAGSLEEMTREKFELVTSVNYTGYFLCVKYASAVMKAQRKYNSGYMADIIEINSKSGLEGSNKNFAYAGSKFGGVGLTQSFALELIPYGIKVNAICPGNLLDGPLWSDPEKGLFKQYLEAGKVPGAKSIADVRRFYESKVPMGRGCTTDDVSCAILYAVEQKYETGQAIPVTGGQIMLK